jgi:predicted transposase YdaD
VVMAHLKMQETRRDKPSRKAWKMRLIRGLHESGYNKTDVLNVFNFVDWVLGLPKPLEIEFWRELKAYEEERKVPYITSVEKIGYDRGLVEGREEEAQRSLDLEQSRVIRRLNRKVGSITEPMFDRINALAIEQLDSLGDALLDFTSIADLTTWLDNQG